MAGRALLFAVFVGLVVSREMEPLLLVLAVVNGLGAGIMAQALGERGGK